MIINGNCIEVLPTLDEQSVHCCVTSPPYWGLRDYGTEEQLGLESTPEAYVENMVGVFREVRRVLRDDGTLWLNIGDSYSRAPEKGGSGTPTGRNGRGEGYGRAQASKIGASNGLKPKDLVGIPWRLAFALQADGWYLRQDIIWHKPAPMPESVRDRCTKAHEYIFLLTKSERYFYDAEAIKEKATCDRKRGPAEHPCKDTNGNSGLSRREISPTRNKRSVWTVNTSPYKGAHFAVFPPKLIEPCILAGSPDQCCSACGKGHRRIVERDKVATRPGTNSKVNRASVDPDSPYESHSGTVVGNRDPKRHTITTKTVGFETDCDCGADSARSVVLDPFFGSGTTGEVATSLGRDYVGIELNPEYCQLAVQRTEQRGLF